MIAKKHLYDALKDYYKILHWLCQKLQQVNLGTITKYTCSDEHVLQLFVAYGFSIQGFMMGCHIQFVIDSYKDSYKRAFLSILTYDEDDGMFSMTFDAISS